MQTKKPYLFLWIWIPVFLILGFFFNEKLELPLNNDDFNFSRFYLCVLLSLFLLISGIAYILCEKMLLNSRLLKLHIFSTCLGLALLFILFLMQVSVDLSSDSGDFREYEYLEDSIRILMGLFVGVGLLFVGFVVYLFNIVSCIFFSNSQK